MASLERVAGEGTGFLILFCVGERRRRVTFRSECFDPSVATGSFAAVRAAENCRAACSAERERERREIAVMALLLAYCALISPRVSEVFRSKAVACSFSRIDVSINS